MDPRGHANDAVLSAMAGALPGGGNARAQQLAGPAGLAVYAYDTLDIACEDGVYAALLGRAEWTDTALAALGAERGDSHALLETYRRHGMRTPHYLHGAFAFVVLDTRTARALLAVDRLGQEALAYTVPSAGGLVFGSSVDALIHHPGVAAHIDPQALFHYLYFHMIPSPLTIYRGLCKLEPAQCLMYEAGQARVERYWRPDFTHVAAADLQAQLLPALRAALRRSAPDSATGAFLSGGLDSSSVAGLLAELQPAGANSYSIGFNEPGYDEIGYARIAARHFKLDAAEYYVTPEDVAAAIPAIAAAYDEPFGNSSAIPVYYCARLAAAHGRRVLLAGDGGDELFAGNSRYALQLLFEYYAQLPVNLRRLVLEPLLTRNRLARRVPLLRRAAGYIDKALIPLPARLQVFNLLQTGDLNTMLTPEFLRAINRHTPLEQLNAYCEEVSGDALDRMLYLDWKITLADNDLRKVNRMCGVHGVEVRYPMLDEAVLRLACGIPSGLKLKGRRLRHYYKEATRDFLPHAILEKKKHGFGLPFGAWLTRNPALQQRVRTALTGMRQRGLIQPSFIDTLMARHGDRHAAYYGEYLWALMMLEEWLQAHQPNYTLTV